MTHEPSPLLDLLLRASLPMLPLGCAACFLPTLPPCFAADHTLWQAACAQQLEAERELLEAAAAAATTHGASSMEADAMYDTSTRAESAEAQVASSGQPGTALDAAAMLRRLCLSGEYEACERYEKEFERRVREGHEAASTKAEEELQRSDPTPYPR